MMKILCRAFAKKLFGAGYEKLIRTVFIDLIVFAGLYTAGFKIRIAPFFVYLMVTAVTSGVMWQALSSEENAVSMQNMIMLPFERRKFVFSYTAILGIYAFLLKTSALFAVLPAVSKWSLTELAGSLLCAGNAILMTAAVFSLKKYRYGGILWIAAVLAVILFLWDGPFFMPLLAASGAFAFFLLQNADGYDFYRRGIKSRPPVNGHRHGLAVIYFFRYLKSHKNYLINTAVMWCAACMLPFFFRQIENRFAVPMGCAILSVNTPVCTLLSGDRDLERAVRFLPGQKRTFCVPYGLFLFLCSLTADGIFLCSIQIQTGSVTAWMIAAAAFLALQSAVLSVLLEWFCPVKNWRIESDLWHHPRKYVVPAALLLLAGALEILWSI